MTSNHVRRATTLTILAVAAAAALAGCGGVGARLTFDDTEKVKVTEIVLKGGSGDVTITTSAISETRIKRIIHRSSDPGQSYKLDGTVLTVDTNCGPDCSVSYAIEAPAGVAVRGALSSGDIALDKVGSADVEATSGDITVTDTTGPTKAFARSGDISVRGSKEATLSTTSGDIRALQVNGPVNARATSGDVDVQMNAPGSVTANASSGDVSLIVPPGAYQIHADAGSGDVRLTGVSNDATSKNVLDLHAASGEVNVVTLGAGPTR